MYGLFNICTFAIVKSIIILYSNKFLFCVIGFDIIQDFIHGTAIFNI